MWREADLDVRVRFGIDPTIGERGTDLLPRGSAFRRTTSIQCDVFSSGPSVMNQLSHSEREPPPRATVNTRLSDGISHFWLARLPSIATRNGFNRLSRDS